MCDAKEDGQPDTSAVGTEDGGDVYEWIDKEYVQKSLREGLKDKELNVVECQVLPATAKGENYSSVVYACKAKDDKGREHRTIVKCLPANPMRQKFAEISQIFRKEIDMYTVILPDFENLMLETGSKAFWPTYYYSTMGDKRDTVVLQDAGPIGYVMRDRRKGLDANHLRVVLEALGQFHAYSVVMKLRIPDAFRKKVVDLFPECILTKSSSDMRMFVANSLEQGSKIVKDWGGDHYGKIADKMVEWKETLYDEIVDMLQGSEGALLTHGDFWVNNMLFKYATEEEAKNGSGRPLEVMFLDFQLARYTLPVIDLLSFMVSSLTTETRRKHWEHTLEHAYLKKFWHTLEAHGHKGDIKGDLYSLEWLKTKLRDSMKYALFVAVGLLRIVVAPTDSVPDLETITEDDMKNSLDVFKFTDKEAVFQERLRGIIDELEGFGIFR